MKKLSASLVPQGYLMLGASDPIDFKTANLIFHHDQGIIFSRAILNQKDIQPSMNEEPIIKRPAKFIPKIKTEQTTELCPKSSVKVEKIGACA